MICCNKYKDHIPQNISIVYYKGDITMVLLTSFVKGQTLFPHENVKRARKEREKKKKDFPKGIEMRICFRIFTCLCIFFHVFGAEALFSAPDS